MDARDVVRLTAACRVTMGAAFLAYPPLTMRAWLGRDASRPTATLLARALGARDMVIGAGTLTTLGERSSLRRWLAAALAADAADLAVTYAERDALPAAGRALVLAIAGGAVGLGVLSLAALGRRES